jgi:UDP-N-acetylmuramoyl-tripeptide--D-alanyl-D-alanine ligase
MSSIEKLYSLFLSHPLITTDSRNCAENSLFFALKGENFDGNSYAAQALSNGCSYAIIDNAEFSLDERTILVEDVLTTLQQLANHHRHQFSIPVIGITGSNGKTTTKELMAAVLSKKYNTLFTQGNLNNHIGVPLTLLSLTHEHQMAIIEMGANHPGEIKQLSQIAEPEYGIITNIGKAHLEGFGSYEGVIKTKKELYDFISITGGTIFVNGENTLLCNLSEGINSVRYGEAPNTFTASLTANYPQLTISVQDDENQYSIETQLSGAYNFENLKAAITIGLYFGVPLALIAEALSEYEPKNNRSQIKNTAKNRLILDYYNANPSSMELAVNEFQHSTFQHKVLILGDMKELGEYSFAEHRAILQKISTEHYNVVICIGEEFAKHANEFSKIEFYASTRDAMAAVERKSLSGKTILLKGSRSMKLEMILPVL